VDDRLDVKLVAEIDPKPLAGVQHQPVAARAVQQPEHRGGAALDVERVPRGAQGQRRSLCAGAKGHECRAGKRSRTGKKAAAGEGGGHGMLLFLQ